MTSKEDITQLVEEKRKGLTPKKDENHQKEKLTQRKTVH